MKLSAGTSQELPRGQARNCLLQDSSFLLFCFMWHFFEAGHCNVRSPTAQITQECRCSSDLPRLRLCSLPPRHRYCTSAVKWGQQEAATINFCCVSPHIPSCFALLQSWQNIDPLSRGLPGKTHCRLSDIKGRILILTITYG